MSHLETLARTPFDLGIFVGVSRQKLRRTFGFLFLLIALASSATTISVTRQLRQLVRKVEPAIDKLPTIEIRNGQASVSVPQPFIYRFGNDDHGRQIVLIIDTTGRRREFAADELGVFLQRTQVVVKTPEQERAISLDAVPDVIIGPAMLHQLIAKWMGRLPWYLAVLAFAWYFVTKTTQALLLVLAALVGSSSSRPLPFRGLFAIGVYALGPVVVLDSVRPWLPFALPWFFALYSVVAIVYAVLGGQRAAASPPSDHNL